MLRQPVLVWTPQLGAVDFKGVQIGVHSITDLINLFGTADNLSDALSKKGTSSDSLSFS